MVDHASSAVACVCSYSEGMVQMHPELGRGAAAGAYISDIDLEQGGQAL